MCISLVGDEAILLAYLHLPAPHDSCDVARLMQVARPHVPVVIMTSRREALGVRWSRIGTTSSSRSPSIFGSGGSRRAGDRPLATDTMSEADR